MRIALTLLAAAVITVQSTQDYKPVSDTEAETYLAQFGYIASGGSQSISKAAASISQDTKTKLKNAIKKFQQMAGLAITGELDATTKAKMAQPRCGVSDVLEVSSAVTSTKWEKTALTYMIELYSPDVTQEAFRQAVQDAFNIWSAVTPLKFTYVTASTADIKIKFGTKSHGDPWPFDGKGQVLAHATLPYSSTRGLLHFDDDEDWTYKDTQKMINLNYVDLVTVAVHEIGHVLGLDHSNDQNAIMAPFYQEPIDSSGKYVTPKLGTDDITKIRALYPSAASICKDTLNLPCNYIWNCWIGVYKTDCKKTCSLC